MCQPLYEYEDPGTGLKIELRRPVEDRDKPITLKRATNVPTRIGILGFEPTEEATFDRKILKAYHKQEEKHGSRFRSHYSKKQLARVWKDG